MVPFLRPEWLGGALYDPLSWDMEVETLLQGFIRFARRAGAEFRDRAGCHGGGAGERLLPA